MTTQLANVEQTLRDYLPNIIHMSLATSANNKPWVCEVHFVYDQDLNLYFRSLADRRHSQELAANPSVSGNIVVQHGPTDKPRGVYFEGQAEQLAVNDASDPVYNLFQARFGMEPEIIDDAKNGGHQFYKIAVSAYYVFDSRESSPSQKYHLKWGR